MQRLLTTTGLLITIAVLYLLAWPVPIDPVAWHAPLDKGYADPFTINDRLKPARLIDLGDHDGPEDAAIGIDGIVYATTSSGAILRIDPQRGEIGVFAETGGRPLGIETDADGSLLIANAYVGLQRITPDGAVIDLLSHLDGQPLVYANDLAVAKNGIVYFSESSARFGARQSGGTYEASLLDIFEHGGHGRVIEFDPATGSTRVLLDGLNFANGIAISENQAYLMISETGHYRILRHWLEGPKVGQTESVLENLPGFPDNINNGNNQRFWVGLIAPRNDMLDHLSDRPLLRKIVQRLPAAFRPKAALSSHVIAITGDGVVLENLHDSDARFPMLTGVLETRDSLYLTALFGSNLPRLDKRDL